MMCGCNAFSVKRTDISIDNELIEECDVDDVDLESFFDNQNDCEYKNSVIETAFRDEYE